MAAIQDATLVVQALRLTIAVAACRPGDSITPIVGVPTRGRARRRSCGKQA